MGWGFGGVADGLGTGPGIVAELVAIGDTPELVLDGVVDGVPDTVVVPVGLSNCPSLSFSPLALQAIATVKQVRETQGDSETDLIEVQYR